MADQARERIGMPLSEWERRWQDGPFELIDGEIIEVSPQKYEHGFLMKLFFLALADYERATGAGEVFTEMPFVEMDSSDWVKGSRVPDLMFFFKARMEEYRRSVSNYRGKPFILLPDLVIEIISPTDLYSEVNHKVAGYRADGVQVIWVIDPRTETIDIWRNDGTQKQLVKTDTLTDPILPGFSLELTKVFTI